MLSLNSIKIFEDFIDTSDIDRMYDFFYTHRDMVCFVDDALLLRAHDPLILANRMQEADEFYEAIKDSNRDDLAELLSLLNLTRKPRFFKDLGEVAIRFDKD